MKKQIEIAPMLDWTDSFFRQFLRLITKDAILYSEMIAEQAIAHGDLHKLLDFSPFELPLILQVGGSTPALMANAAQKAAEFGYTGININAGCPSERVFAGSFGACLMADPKRVAACVEAMRSASNLEVSIKTRIALDNGQDEEQSFDSCCNFIETTHKSGCDKYIIHARLARLKGLTPKENRQKIALNYPLVYRVKKEFPKLNILINGNITSTDQIVDHLQYMDGVMIGRWAYAKPYELANIDATFFGDTHDVLSRKEILERLMPIIVIAPKPLHLTRHLMGLYWGTPYSKAFKQTLLANSVRAIEDFLQKTDL